MSEPVSEHPSGGNAALMQPDDSREPTMERAMPADAVPGSTIPEDTDAEGLLADGSWVWCRVIGQRRDRYGRWCVGIRWYASSAVGGREGWYLFDPAGIRRPKVSYYSDRDRPTLRARCFLRAYRPLALCPRWPGRGHRWQKRAARSPCSR
jgi:hypothetical protein